jgi:hypothetical protein
MTTITGTITDAKGAPLYVDVLFTPTTAPYITAGGTLIAPPTVKERTVKADGSFSVDLAPGAYAVAVETPAVAFNIVVPNGGGPYTIDQLTNLEEPVPWNPAFNGNPEGKMAARPGYFSFDHPNQTVYIKDTGTGPYGWVLFSKFN